MDLEKVRTQWKDMQTERAKERTLLKKVLKQLRKSIARAGNKEKLETLLKYLEEQLE